MQNAKWHPPWFVAVWSLQLQQSHFPGHPICRRRSGSARESGRRLNRSPSIRMHKNTINYSLICRWTNFDSGKMPTITYSAVTVSKINGDDTDYRSPKSVVRLGLLPLKPLHWLIITHIWVRSNSISYNRVQNWWRFKQNRAYEIIVSYKHYSAMLYYSHNQIANTNGGLYAAHR